jgi:CheY-like chemotaxis protein
MSDKAFCIFVVDDDPLMRLVITDQLDGNDYEIREFENGADCLAALDSEPDLILLDVEMPGMGGLEVCKTIREQGRDNVQIIFVTAHDDLETLMAAFEVGGNDFILKNAGEDVLLRKVVMALHSLETRKQLNQQLSYAQQAAFTAMYSLGETGIVLDFFRSCLHCASLTPLAELLGKTLQQFSVNGLIKLVGQYEEVDYSSTNRECTALEQSILSYVGKLGRLHQNGDRLVLNYPNITLLVTGLNLEDEDTLGRLRDHLAIIAETAGVRVEAINIEQQRLQQVHSRIDLAAQLAGSLAAIESQMYQNNSELESFTDQYLGSLDALMVSQNLTDSQENAFRQVLDQLIQRLQGYSESHARLFMRLGQVLDKQKALLGN